MRLGPVTGGRGRPRRMAYNARQARAFMGAAIAEPPGLWVIQFCSAVTVWVLDRCDFGTSLGAISADSL